MVVTLPCHLLTVDSLEAGGALPYPTVPRCGDIAVVHSLAVVSSHRALASLVNHTTVVLLQAVHLLLKNSSFFHPIMCNVSQGEVSGFDVVGEDELKKFLTASSEKSNISDDSGDLKRSSSSTEEGKLVLGSASADSAGPSSPMPKILSHVWHGKSGYWAPAETAEDDGVAGTAKSPA